MEKIKKKIIQKITFKGQYKSAVYAVHAVAGLPNYGFIIYRGRIVQCVGRGKFKTAKFQHTANLVT